MVKNIGILNLVTSKQEDIAIDGSTDYVLESVDWGSPSGNLKTYRLQNQIGETIVSTEVSTRQISITGYVYARMDGSYLGMSWNDYYAEQEEKIEEAKDRLNRLINLFNDVRIYAGDCYIDGRPTSAVKYGTDIRENNEVLCAFTLEITCGDPMFVSNNDLALMLTGVEKEFIYPWRIKETKTNTFGAKINVQNIEVTNNGDVEVGGIITITASGGQVVNPVVYKTSTGEQMEVDITLDDGDILTINTNPNEEDVTLYDASEGEEQTAVEYILEGSTFIRFSQGSGIYGYGVDSGQQYAGINFEIKEKYFNIKEE